MQVALTQQDDSALCTRNVKAVLEEAPGKILIGTYRGGLFRWEDGRISVPETNRQPFSRWAQCLLRDRDQNRWIGSYAGAPDGICLPILTPTERRAVSLADCGRI